MTSRISSNQQLLRLGADTVTVVIEPDALSRLPQMLKACDADAVVLVVDEWLWPMHARTVTGLLGARGATVWPICPERQATALVNVAPIAERAAELAGRRPCVVGFGGGRLHWRILAQAASASSRRER